MFNDFHINLKWAFIILSRNVKISINVQSGILELIRKPRLFLEFYIQQWLVHHCYTEKPEHAMAQTLGGMVAVMHGQCVAAMLTLVMEYNWMGEPEKFARIAEALNVNTFGMSIDVASKASILEDKQLVRELNVPSLIEQGVNPKEIERYAKAAFDDPQTIGNSRQINIDGYKWIYGRCFGEEESTIQ